MTTPTLAPASRAPVVDLDTRLDLVDAAMDVLLDHALLAFDVSTAHLPDTAPAPPVAPILPAPEPPPAPSSPLAAVYLGAIQVIRERGWTRGNLRDEHGAVCAVGAIRYAAATSGQADDACAHLLDVIQREFTDAHTVPSWNDQQTSAAPVIRILGTAANNH